MPSLALAAAAAVASPAAAVKAFVAEYSLAEFAKTIKGAEHMQPPEVIEQIYDLFNAASAASGPGKPSAPHWKAVEDLVKSSYYVDPADGNSKPLNGHWPPANGGYQRRNVQLKKGDVFDRYQGDVVDKKPDPANPANKLPLEAGDEFNVTFIGTFMSPMGTAGTPPVPQSFESRALDRAENKYPLAYTVEVLNDVPIDLVEGELAEVIPWYGQPGGGTQMRLLFKDNTWRYQEWKQMQDQGFLKVDLKSSPSGDYKVLPNNRAKKLK
ncbi:glycohydrolase toxin TNT-related protein [Hymenobacter cellulosivorans]|uniref:TNT domain-containing protein n=1 Tax=Hymenobacter cellulosivorans TaxID=2932249 RepID=A0ABY4F903_9BACT|nr:glycohydrolase toxin TNT-related protein [Hymenobacter cellulosivorans]UOQ52602.1 TNT domain-containing protein [Hymenobacter cellulosivorans]